MSNPVLRLKYFKTSLTVLRRLALVVESALSIKQTFVKIVLPPLFFNCLRDEKRRRWQLRNSTGMLTSVL